MTHTNVKLFPEVYPEADDLIARMDAPECVGGSYEFPCRHCLIGYFNILCLERRKLPDQTYSTVSGFTTFNQLLHKQKYRYVSSLAKQGIFIPTWPDWERLRCFNIVREQLYFRELTWYEAYGELYPGKIKFKNPEDLSEHYNRLVEWCVNQHQ